MRVLLLGGSGLLGSALRDAVPRDVSMAAPPSREADVGDERAVSALVARERPDIVINAAGFTNVDAAETDVASAERVNAKGPGIIADACSEHGAHLIHVSTDYVFDGAAGHRYGESEAPHPINAYGRSKLDGELAVSASGCRFLIIRTSWLFGSVGRSFPRTMWTRARDRLPTAVVDDQFGRPTAAFDLAPAVWLLAAGGAEGVLHVTNSGPITTWYAIARQVFDSASAGPLLSPCDSESYSAAAARPRHAVLDTSAYEGRFGPLPDWRDALGRFLSELEGR